MGLYATPRHVLAGAAMATMGALLLGSTASCLSPDSEDTAVAESSVVGSVVRSFQDGVAPATSYAGTTDTYLSQDAPATVYGTASTVRVDGDHVSGSDLVGLVRWDVSSIPAGSTVRDVTLTLNITNPGGPYQIYEAKRAWTEGSATWITAKAGTAWEVPGAAGATDRGALLLGTVKISAGGSYTVQLNSSGVAVVQRWVQDPATNAGFVIANTSTSDGVAFTSRHSSTTSLRPKLTVGYDGGATDAGAVLDATTPPPTGDVQPTFPIRAAFYYPWFPEAWNQSGYNPFTNYTPSLGSYDTNVAVTQHVAEMQYGNIGVGIASWWGQGSKTDQRIPNLLRAADGTTFRWSVYYENESTGDPSVAQITSDLTYLRDKYGKDPSFLRVNGRFVVFVYADGADACAMADRWKSANAGIGAYIVLKVFSGYATCASQPDGWHQYAPAVAVDSQGTNSYAISPGFWLKGAAERLPRDLARFQQNVKDMAASSARFHLVTTFNEWGEGTAVESAKEWATASGHGAYLDALHAVANRGGLTGGGGTTDAGGGGGGGATDAGGGGTTDAGSAGTTPTDANLKVAFIGDTASGANFKSVLDLIRAESAQMVMIQGDLTYNGETPDQWFPVIDNEINSAWPGSTAPVTIPYFVAKGNHDTAWPTTSAGLKDRMTKWGIAPENADPTAGNYSVVHRGLKMVMVTDSETSPTRADYVNARLGADPHLWKICSWHKDQRATNVGPKSDEMGWQIYENCRNNGAIVVQGHSHTYSRSKTITNDTNQTVDGACSDPFNLCVSNGRHIFLDSSLGGVETRTLDATWSAMPYWGTVYSGSFGALFVTFNVDGDPRKARGYFKTVGGAIVNPPPSSGMTSFVIQRTP